MNFIFRMGFIGNLLLGVFSFTCFSQEIGIGNGIINNNYIGGYFKYDVASYPVYNSAAKNITFRVTNTADFLKRLAQSKKGTVIYLEDNGVFDFTGKSKIQIPAGVTILSGRGQNKGVGALVFTKDFDANPLFRTGGNDVLISGVRFQGPDAYIVNPASPKDNVSYGLPNSSFLHIYHKNVVVENCEIFNWSQSGIYIRKGGQAEIHHNYIHHNQRQGLGYGVTNDGGFGDIYANIFDFNRHAIAGTGISGTAYIAKYNICLPNSTLQGHIFDMHGGTDRKDGTTLAGDSIIISNNLFYVKNKPAILIRGMSNFNSIVENNSIVNSSNDKGNAVQRNDQANGLLKKIISVLQAPSRETTVQRESSRNADTFILQKNAKGKFEVRNNQVTEQ